MYLGTYLECSLNLLRKTFMAIRLQPVYVTSIFILILIFNCIICHIWYMTLLVTFTWEVLIPQYSYQGPISINICQNLIFSTTPSYLSTRELTRMSEIFKRCIHLNIYISKRSTLFPCLSVLLRREAHLKLRKLFPWKCIHSL